jgi:thioredoxin-related protein
MKYFLITLLFIVSTAKAQQVYNFNQLDSLQKIENRKVLVFVYTNWCSYCKVMDQFVFKDIKVIHLLNEQYYFVGLNAEEKQPIIYQNKRFIFKQTLGYHEMAIALANKKKLIFPSTYILNNDNEIIYQHHEFINANNLSKLLIYFTTNN